jgi:hypothetical protein
MATHVITGAIPQLVSDAAALGQVTDIYASDDGSAALLNNGTLVGWGPGSNKLPVSLE